MTPTFKSPPFLPGVCQVRRVTLNLNYTGYGLTEELMRPNTQSLVIIPPGKRPKEFNTQITLKAETNLHRFMNRACDISKGPRAHFDLVIADAINATLPASPFATSSFADLGPVAAEKHETVALRVQLSHGRKLWDAPPAPEAPLPEIADAFPVIFRYAINLLSERGEAVLTTSLDEWLRFYNAFPCLQDKVWAVHPYKGNNRSTKLTDVVVCAHRAWRRGPIKFDRHWVEGAFGVSKTVVERDRMPDLEQRVTLTGYTGGQVEKFSKICTGFG